MSKNRILNKDTILNFLIGHLAEWRLRIMDKSKKKSPLSRLLQMQLFEEGFNVWNAVVPINVYCAASGLHLVKQQLMNPFSVELTGQKNWTLEMIYWLENFQSIRRFTSVSAKVKFTSRCKCPTLKTSPDLSALICSRNDCSMLNDRFDAN